MESEIKKPELLPCPFCGSEASKSKNWMDTIFSIHCSNTDCAAQPGIIVKANCVENEGDTKTYHPLWEDAELKAIDVWNNRSELTRLQKREKELVEALDNRAVESGAAMIKHFTHGYMKCIESLFEWNDGLGKPDIALHNRLVSLENGLNKRVSDLFQTESQALQPSPVINGGCTCPTQPCNCKLSQQPESETDEKAQEPFYCADWIRVGAFCEQQCPACKKTDLLE